MFGGQDRSLPAIAYRPRRSGSTSRGREPFAVDDAVDLAYLFAFDLRLMMPPKVVLGLAGDPRKVESQKRLEALSVAGARVTSARQVEVYAQLDAQRRAAGTNGLFVASLATHGFSDQGGDFLVAADSLRRRIERTGVAVAELFDDVARSPAPRRLVLLDACRERLSADTRAGRETQAAMSRSFAAAIASASGQAVLAGATIGGYAYDDPARRNGVFTGALLDGLMGRAGVDERGFITVRTLADYADRRVVEWVRDHRPDHAVVSQGIARRIEGAAALLPLAVDPARRQAEEAWRTRRDAALVRLRENFGETITGAFYDEVAAALGGGSPRPEVEPLLEEIEALDGEARSQRSLAYYFQHHFPSRPQETMVGSGPVAAPRVSPAGYALVDPKPEGVLQAEPATGARRRRWVLAVVAVITLVLASRVWLWPLWIGEPPLADQTTSPLPTGSEPSTDQVGDSNPASEHEAGDLWIGPLEMRFHYIPEGTFQMGSPEEAGRDDETLHEVELTRGFWMGETEVTQAQWRKLMSSAPSHFKNCGGECPVESVSWFEAITYANLLSEDAGYQLCYELGDCTGKSGGGCEESELWCSGDYSCEPVSLTDPACKGFRLPTEAEWEYAARAGEEGAIYTGNLSIQGANDAPELDVIAWYGGNSKVEYQGGFDCSDWPEKQYPSESCGTGRVGQKAPNRWGLRDVLGNVWEWTWDRYGDYQEGPVTNPMGAKRGSIRVVRGGSWLSIARYCRSAFRFRSAPGFRYAFFGFRLVRTAD